MTDDTTPSAGLEARARHFLAGSYRQAGLGLEANNIERGRLVDDRWNAIALRAIRAAICAETGPQHAEAVARAVAEEREACAALAGEWACRIRSEKARQFQSSDKTETMANLSENLAAAIRGRA